MSLTMKCKQCEQNNRFQKVVNFAIGSVVKCFKCQSIFELKETVIEGDAIQYWSNITPKEETE